MTEEGTVLEGLFERAKDYVMSPEESEAQRRSFAYGNANIANQDITREGIAVVAEEIPRPYKRKN